MRLQDRVVVVVEATHTTRRATSPARLAVDRGVQGLAAAVGSVVASMMGLRLVLVALSAAPQASRPLSERVHSEAPAILLRPHIRVPCASVIILLTFQRRFLEDRRHLKCTTKARS